MASVLVEKEFLFLHFKLPSLALHVGTRVKEGEDLQ